MQVCILLFQATNVCFVVHFNLYPITIFDAWTLSDLESVISLSFFFISLQKNKKEEEEIFLKYKLT